MPARLRRVREPEQSRRRIATRSILTADEQGLRHDRLRAQEPLAESIERRPCLYRQELHDRRIEGLRVTRGTRTRLDLAADAFACCFVERYLDAVEEVPPNLGERQRPSASKT